MICLSRKLACGPERGRPRRSRRGCRRCTGSSTADLCTPVGKDSRRGFCTWYLCCTRLPGSRWCLVDTCTRISCRHGYIQPPCRIRSCDSRLGSSPRYSHALDRRMGSLVDSSTEAGSCRSGRQRSTRNECPCRALLPRRCKPGVGLRGIQGRKCTRSRSRFLCTWRSRRRVSSGIGPLLSCS